MNNNPNTVGAPDRTCVGDNDVGRRIDLYVAERCGSTRSAAQKLLENGSVRVGGIAVSKNYKLRVGDTVDIDIPEPEPCDVTPQNIPIDIVYEDRDLLVVNKPKGMVVHPAPGNPDGTLVNALLWHCGDSLSGINGVIRPGIVHRIDKDTSGLLIVAKNDAAHLGLAEQIAVHSFLRSYQAVIVGRMREDHGDIDAPIGRHPVDRKKMTVVSDGRNALTHYSTIREYSSGFSHMNLVLETGRTHQIRVHMSHMGHPLLCDELYGGGKTKFERQVDELVRGQCLHAKTIGFVHPITGKKLYFDSELPDYFKIVLDKLEKLEKAEGNDR